MSENINTLLDKVRELQGEIEDILFLHSKMAEGLVGFYTVAQLVADTDATANLDVGTIIGIVEHGGFNLIKVSSGIVDFTTAGGGDFRVIGWSVSPLWYGAIGNGTADDTAFLNKANASDALQIDLQGQTYKYVGVWASSKVVVNGSIVDNQGTKSFELLTLSDVATPAQTAAGAPGGLVPTIDGIAALIAAQVAAATAPNIVQTVFEGLGLYSAAVSHEITPLNTSITTRRLNARVMIKVELSFEREENGMLEILRNGVPVATNTQPNPGTRNVGMAPVPYDGNQASTLQHISMSFLDTVSAIGTYEYRVRVKGTQNTFALNRTIADADSVLSERGISLMILEELPPT